MTPSSGVLVDNIRFCKIPTSFAHLGLHRLDDYGGIGDTEMTKRGDGADRTRGQHPSCRRWLPNWRGFPCYNIGPVSWVQRATT